MKRVIMSLGAPAAIGPYSQAVEANGALYVSGQIPIVPISNELREGGIVEQTEQVFSNLKAILSDAGYSFTDVVKTTVLLADIDDFSKMNEVYAKYFTCQMPARATFEVAKLPRNAKVEIELVAVKEKPAPAEKESGAQGGEQESSHSEKPYPYQRKPFRM